MNTEMTKGRRTLILINACVITFMATLDGSIVNIALPTIASAFRVGISSIQWVVTSYLVTVSALLLVWGRLSDMYGRKRFFLMGLAVFTVGSFFCGISGNLLTIVASRVLQAIGASMAIALVQGIVTHTFPPSERGKALGFIGSVVAVGSLIGPSLGGLLVEISGWRSIFFINVPVGIAGVLLTIIILPESEGRPDTETFDWRGAVLLFLSVSLFFSGMLAFQEGLLSPVYSFMVMASAGVLFFFFLLDQRRPHPLVDGCLFSSRIFTMGVIDSSLSYMAMYSYIFFMPFYLQTVRGVGVLEAGLLMSLYPLITAFLAPAAGALSDKITYRPLTITGLILSGSGLVSLSFLGSRSSLLLIGSIIVLLGIGGALFQSPNNSSIMGSVPRDRLGIAGSLNAFFRNLGMVSGTTLAVSLFSFSTKMTIDSVSSGLMNSPLFLRGFRLVVLTAAMLAFLGALGEVFGKKKGVSLQSACEERS